MKTKICTECKALKLLITFPLNKELKDGRDSWCKKCHNINNKNYYKKHPWKQTLVSIKQRCNNPKNNRYKTYGGRGIKCLITTEELKKLWFRDKAYNMKKPSIDRKNNDGDYTYGNCRYIELNKNVKRVNKLYCSKQINQYDLQDNFIKMWKSLMEIQRTLKYSHGNISSVCNGRFKQAYGFKWGFKNV